MELQLESEPEPEHEPQRQTRASALIKPRYSIHEIERERVAFEDYEAVEVVVSLGWNRVSDGIDIPNVPDKIVRSRTGGYFIVLDESNIPLAEDILDILKIFDKTTLLTITLEDNNELDSSNISADAVVFYPDLGYAWTALTDDQVAKVNRQKNRFKIQTERIVTGVGQANLSSNSTQTQPSPNTNDWGIEKVEAHLSTLTGAGVNVAILDTGFDTGHPDYPKTRSVTSATFVGLNGEDDNGHGMHCTGIACGYLDSNGVRYGVAYESNIFSCKILDRKGECFQRNIISGIYWALRNKCKVILLSVEIPNNGNRLADVTTFRALRFAQKMGCIVVAAAGNGSNRNVNVINAISHPSDCQFAMAISATDQNDHIYNQANRAFFRLRQSMTAIAPGVDIYSSWSRQALPSHANFKLSGTSMAAPFVAGIIALLWEKYPTSNLGKILVEFRRICTNTRGWSTDDAGIGMPIVPRN